ncbi:MAG: acyl-CoA dehydrogenase family protein [Actinomycetota bacterium]
MDLSFTPEQEAFRSEVREWLDEHVPTSLPSAGTREGFEAHRAWEQHMFRAGYGAIRWPVDYGGRGADIVEQAIFEEEYFLARAPERITVLGRNLMGPTLMTHGNEEQKRVWLPGILSADTIWSQGFSEPGAGSDLASLTTRAVREGDELIVTGQKIWTSYGAFADWIFALVRTDPEAPKHGGITFLAIDMTSPGVEARPIVQLDGQAGFAEVFFDGVRVPAANVVGELNGGWGVAMTTLGFERDAPAAPAARFLRQVRDLVAIARARGLAGDPVVRDRVASLFVRAETYRLQTLRKLSRVAHGESVGAEASAMKLQWSELGRDAYETGLELLDAYGEVSSEDSPLPDPEQWRHGYWLSRAATIYAGTSEIQRNIIAERVLGLPKG